MLLNEQVSDALLSVNAIYNCTYRVQYILKCEVQIKNSVPCSKCTNFTT